MAMVVSICWALREHPAERDHLQSFVVTNWQDTVGWVYGTPSGISPSIDSDQNG